MLTSEHPEPHLVLPETSTPTPPIVPVPTTLSELDTQRICELLARFSQYTQQFEREEAASHDNQPQTEKTQALGTL